METLKDIISQIYQQVQSGTLSPVQVAQYMLKLESYRHETQLLVENNEREYRLLVAGFLKDKMPKSKAEARAQASDAYSSRQMCRIEADHLDKIISQLKYYQKGVEAEWNNIKRL